MPVIEDSTDDDGLDELDRRLIEDWIERGCPN